MRRREVPTGASGDASTRRAEERRRIVTSKLLAPSLRPGVIRRPALVDRLASAPDVPVVLVSAPAGYGKTTLMALWSERDERPFAWISLEPGDNDVAAFIGDLVSALDPIVTLDSRIANGLSLPEPPLEEVVLPALDEAVVGAGEPFVLVFDNLHLVTERRCHAAIGYLAERMPPGSQLALATRTTPTLPLASLRAHASLEEIGASELALGATEADAVLRAAGVRLTKDQVARLVTRAEGWPAAIYLAALSLRDRPDKARFVDRFAGTSRHVADYLSDDVLARQPNDVIAFLLRTCILSELTASLCDAVSGGSNAGEMLRRLDRSNLFVVPLDEERVAYRYHHLFAEYLRAELARREPDLIRELHRRAWMWYREHGIVGRAVTHAHAAGDLNAAAELTAADWLQMVDGGQIDTIRTRIAAFDTAEIEAHAPLAIAAAWVAGLDGEGERAMRFAEAARRGSWDGPMPDGSASFDSALSMLSSAFGLGGITGMLRDAQRAVDLEVSPGPWRAVALLLLGVAQTLEGLYAEARKSLTEAARLTGGVHATGAFALAYVALICDGDGDDEEALQHLERARAEIDRPGMRDYLPSIGTYAMDAHLLSRRGDLDGAARAVHRASALLPKVTEAFWWQRVASRILLASALASLDRRDEASVLLDEAAEVLARHPDAGNLPEKHAQQVRRQRVARHEPHLSDSLSDAESRILRLLASDLTLRDIGRELYLSLNTVKSHTRSIYRKLGVSSRTDAVRAARRQPQAAAPEST